MNSTATQCRQILEHLQSGDTLTQLDALRLYGVGRLAARVHDLRKRGHAIEKEMIRVAKSDGGITWVASYKLG